MVYRVHIGHINPFQSGANNFGLKDKEDAKAATAERQSHMLSDTSEDKDSQQSSFYENIHKGQHVQLTTTGAVLGVGGILAAIAGDNSGYAGLMFGGPLIHLGANVLARTTFANAGLPLSQPGGGAAGYIESQTAPVGEKIAGANEAEPIIVDVAGLGTEAYWGAGGSRISGGEEESSEEGRGEALKATESEAESAAETLGFTTLSSPDILYDDQLVSTTEPGPGPEPGAYFAPPSLLVNAASGDESGPIDLPIEVKSQSENVEEDISVIVSGVPSDATLSAGINNGDGTWTVQASELENLKFLPPIGRNEFELSVTAYATSEGETLASVPAPLTVGVAAAGVLLVGGPGRDILRGSEWSDEIHAGDGNDRIYGYAGEDILYGQAGADVIYGGEHDDVIYGDEGQDVLYGDAGQDILYGGSDEDKLYGGGGADILRGEQGADILSGDAGADILIGGEGADTLYGGTGDDVFYYNVATDSFDVFYGDAGYDTILNTTPSTAMELNDFSANSSIEEINVGGVDIHGTEAGNVLDFSATALTDVGDIHGLGGDDVLSGSAAADTIYGDAGADVISGNEGNDTLFGGEGEDIIHGGTGDDVITGGEGVDTLYGDEGQDVFMYDSATDSSDTFSGGGGYDTIQNTGGTMVFGSFKPSDSIEEIRAEGAEIHGTEGKDVLDFSGTSLLDAGAIQGLGGNDTITGSSGADIIFGGEGKDTLYGGAGDDIFYGGFGNDKLFGEAGNDLFVFEEGSGRDTVAGGEGAGWTDTISLSSEHEGPDLGSWVLNTKADYTIDETAGTLTFNDQDASGTITFDDGDKITFSEIEEIHWG